MRTVYRADPHGGNSSVAETFDTLEQAEAFIIRHGLVFATSATCDHPDEERLYYVDANSMVNDEPIDDILDRLYGHGFEPNITPEIIED